MYRCDDQGGPQPPKPGWSEPTKEDEKKETPPEEKKEDKQ